MLHAFHSRPPLPSIPSEAEILDVFKYRTRVLAHSSRP